jgi:copper chaperone CopZ
MKKLLLIAVSTLAIGCPSTDSTTQPVSLLVPPIPVNGKIAPAYQVYVKGLVCPSCAIGLKKGLMKLPFVESIYIDYKTGLTLIYEKQSRDKGGEELDKLRIIKAVKDSGYEVDKFKD